MRIKLNQKQSRQQLNSKNNISVRIALVSTHEILVMKSILVVLTDKQVPKIVPGTRHKTFVKPEPTMKVKEVLEAAKRAKEAGSTRFCMGAAWRHLTDTNLQKISDMIKEVKKLGLET